MLNILYRGLYIVGQIGNERLPSQDYSNTSRFYNSIAFPSICKPSALSPTRCVILTQCWNKCLRSCQISSESSRRNVRGECTMEEITKGKEKAIIIYIYILTYTHVRYSEKELGSAPLFEWSLGLLFLSSKERRRDATARDIQKGTHSSSKISENQIYKTNTASPKRRDSRYLEETMSCLLPTTIFLLSYIKSIRTIGKIFSQCIANKSLSSLFSRKKNI